MKSIAEAIAESFKPQKHGRSGSELDAIIVEISKVVPMTKQYNFNYWRGILSRRQIRFSDMIGILKQISAMHEKYNKGAVLVTLICKFPKRLKVKKPEKLQTLTLFKNEKRCKKMQ